MNKINIPSREKKILSVLNAKHGIVTSKELSTKIGVSERTIRSDISHINSELDSDIKKVLDNLSKSQGVELSEGEYYHLSQIKQQLVFLCLKTYSKNYVLNNTDIRCHEIVNNLLADLLRNY